jgi:thioredoxin 1
MEVKMRRLALGIIIILAVMSVVISGCTPAPKDSAMGGADDAANGLDTMVKDDAMTDDSSGSMMDDKDGSILKDDSMMDDDTASKGNSMEVKMMNVYSGTILAGSATPYIEFNKQDYDKALAEGKSILLYFYASWCPTCKAEQPKIFEAFDSMDSDNIIGFRVNYQDSETDSEETALAKQFGVAYQHTKVILSNGERVLKSPESWDTERYLDELDKYK